MAKDLRVTWILVVLVTVGSQARVASSQSPQTTSESLLNLIQPVERRDRLVEGRTYPFIVRARDEARKALESALREHAVPMFKGGLEKARLGLVDGYAAKATPAALKKLARIPGVLSVWLLDRRIDQEYARILKGLEYVVRTNPDPGPINISLGPPPSAAARFDEEEPLHLAFRRVTEAGKLVVLAAGNNGPAEGTLSPWCLSRWVVCVGAATQDGTQLWSRSARGKRGDSLWRPTVVAAGVDILTAHPKDVPKTKEELEAERRTGFEQRVPEDKRDLYTVVTGTSMAAAQVSRAAGQIFFYLSKVQSQISGAQRDRDSREEPTQAVMYQGALESRDSQVRTERLIGEVEGFGSIFVAIYPARPDPLVVKQMLMDAAIPMAGFDEHEVGSGFVHPELIEQQFGQFGIAEPAILPVKVIP